MWKISSPESVSDDSVVEVDFFEEFDENFGNLDVEESPRVRFLFRVKNGESNILSIGVLKNFDFLKS